MESAGRRSFRKSMGVISANVASFAHPLSAAMRLADVIGLGDRRSKYTETCFLMGTTVSITALHISRDAAEQAVKHAFEEIERLSAIFDRHCSGTPVSHLNETGKLTDVPPELFEVMGKAQVYYHRSNGAFDSTVLPVLDMLQRNRDAQGRLQLSRSDFDDALALVGTEFVKVSRNGISFDRRSMAVTLDGIGRGYIVDRASDILAAEGIENHLVMAGGDVRARGERSPGQPWIVAVADRSGGNRTQAVIALKDAAVATSGGSEIYFDAEGSNYHVSNQQAAGSQRKGLSLSVVAPTVLEADALSTAAFVMNPNNAISFIDSLSRSECLLTGFSGMTMNSRNWDSSIRI